MNSSQVAYKAAEIMSRKGHCKNTLEDPEGRVCFLGAVMMAQLGTETLYGEGNRYHHIWDETVDQILTTAGEVLDERGILTAVTFNNREDTSAEDVILLLKETGKRLEK